VTTLLSDFSQPKRTKPTYFFPPQTKDLKPHALAIFPHSNGVGDFVPEHLYVRYHKDSRIIVLLDRERTRYRVYMVPQAQAQYVEPVDDVNHDLGLDDWVNLSMEV